MKEKPKEIKKESVKIPAKKAYDKKDLFFGIVFLLASFLCIFAIFYLTFKDHTRQADEYTALQEKTVILNEEKTVLSEEARELKAKVGTSVSLDNLLAEAQKTYGPDEAKRTEGFLWIDRAAKTWYVTLGAVQGLVPGDRLTIFDGDKEVGSVRVETPLDVISYVYPINKEMNDFPLDYYRAVIAK